MPFCRGSHRPFDPRVTDPPRRTRGCRFSIPRRRGCHGRRKQFFLSPERTQVRPYHASPSAMNALCSPRQITAKSLTSRHGQKRGLVPLLHVYVDPFIYLYLYIGNQGNHPLKPKENVAKGYLQGKLESWNPLCQIHPLFFGGVGFPFKHGISPKKHPFWPKPHKPLPDM